MLISRNPGCDNGTWRLREGTDDDYFYSRKVWTWRPTGITPPIIRAQITWKQRTTVIISDPEEEEMNDIRLRTTERRRTSSRRRTHPDNKYARFPPMIMLSTPVPQDDTAHSTPSPNPSSELVRISTL
ncbi:hypothetical protein JTE90_010255 [Oedothorax gibbosus]|uniref:Uncharacterized protein n=1 Tax=Oedothorax gibbosus TaxID=931172 RepID=A0AAV6U6U1_9ARAC|nr:hypothetical protein JTE90_010255 [Oedothorax gibbosus]